VGVQIAAQRGAQLGDLVGERGEFGVGLLELLQVGGDLTAVRLDDDGRGLVADALEVLERGGADPAVELGVVQAGDDGGRGAEGLDSVGRLAGALQEEGDPPERGRGGELPGQGFNFFACLVAFFCAFAARLEAFS
jgi:hypothetical protein